MSFLKPSAKCQGSKIGLKSVQYGLNATIAMLVLVGVGGGLVEHNSQQGHTQSASQSVSVSQAASAQNFSTVASVTQVPTAQISGNQYKTTIWLNLRSGAGFNYSVIGAGVTGTTVTATGNVSGIWYEVKMGNQTGWMSSEYLNKVATAAPAPAPASTNIAVAQYKTTIQLNFRSGPGLDQTILGSGATGTTVTSTGKTSGVWYEVKMGNQTGWMSSEYLTKVAGTPAPAPAPAPVPSTPAPTSADAAGTQYKTTIQLNMRSGPSFNNSVIGFGYTGTTVTGTGKSDGVWLEVKMGNQTGWMSSDYLRAVTGPNSDTELKAFAAAKLGNAQQAQCLNTLWERESNWNYRAINTAFSPNQAGTPELQAYGIAQAAPGSKMAAAGADWKTNPRTQISWGIDYIKDRHGNPCSALTFHSLRGWY